MPERSTTSLSRDSVAAMRLTASTKSLTRFPAPSWILSSGQPAGDATAGMLSSTAGGIHFGGGISSPASEVANDDISPDTWLTLIGAGDGDSGFRRVSMSLRASVARGADGCLGTNACQECDAGLGLLRCSKACAN